jgi:hypothetical protein
VSSIIDLVMYLFERERVLFLQRAEVPHTLIAIMSCLN